MEPTLPTQSARREARAAVICQTSTHAKRCPWAAGSAHMVDVRDDVVIHSSGRERR